MKHLLYLLAATLTWIVGAVDPIEQIKTQATRKKGIVLLTALTVAVGLSIGIYVVAEKQSAMTIQALQETNAELEATQRYAHVAMLGAEGLEIAPGPGMYVSTPLYNALKGSYVINDSGLHYYCGGHEEQYYEAISVEPDFPFSYYALADCKRQSPQRDWRPDAEKAISILRETTKIGGHKPVHDEVLQRLLSWE